MQLTMWTYEGPPHVGAMRIATAMDGVHLVLHAPQGDTYADLLFTMIERRDHRPPVTWTTFQARDLGGDTADLFKASVSATAARFKPDVMLVGATCTAELLQDDPGGLAKSLGLAMPVVKLELPSYQKKENWGAAETCYQLTRALCLGQAPASGEKRATVAERAASAGRKPRANILGPTALGFRHRDDVTEIARLLTAMGIDIFVVAPLGASAHEVARLPEADFNVVLYPETAGSTAAWLKRVFHMPATTIVPMGVVATRAFIDEVAAIAGVDAALGHAQDRSRLPWYSRSVDSTYLTGKRVFVFGDASHAIAAARAAKREFGFDVVGLGTYSREFAREVREAAAEFGIEALITDDYLEVEALAAELRPDLMLGTQMERHVAKRLGVPCAVISAPVHVQDFPARYAPVMGFAGADVLFDTWVHPLMMGLEEHLLQMFRDDFEFNEAPSHLGRAGAAPRERDDAVEIAEVPASTTTFTSGGGGGHRDAAPVAEEATDTLVLDRPTDAPAGPAVWSAEAEKELKKIPFFVRSKARRNTETYARDRGVRTITIETLYDAKAHFSR
jgi:light-independent protochlorophyllide reductase subunit B